MDITELRLMSANEHVVMERYIDTDAQRIEDKKSEWRDDSWNRYCSIGTRTWRDGFVTGERWETIY